jgi:Chlorophyll A-B binding protein
MQTGTNNSTNATENQVMATDTTPAVDNLLELEYNGIDRNAWIFGFNPQQELWNGRLAMIGFVAYLIWDIAGYSVLRDVLHFVR